MVCVERMDDLLAVSAAERRFTLTLWPRLSTSAKPSTDCRQLFKSLYRCCDPRVFRIEVKEALAGELRRAGSCVKR